MPVFSHIRQCNHRRRRPLSTGPGWRRATPARPAYFDFLQIPPLTSAGKVSIARAELVEAITARTGRRTVAKPGRGAQGSASGGPQNASDLSPSASRRVACRALNGRRRRVSSRKIDCKCPRRLGATETRGGICNRWKRAPNCISWRFLI